MQRKTHLKQTQSRPLLQQSKFDAEDSDLIIDDEIKLGRNLKSRDFGKLIDSDGDFELSNHVKFRLWQARQLALAKFKEARG